VWDQRALNCRRSCVPQRSSRHCNCWLDLPPRLSVHSRWHLYIQLLSSKFFVLTHDKIFSWFYCWFYNLSFDVVTSGASTFNIIRIACQHKFVDFLMSLGCFYNKYCIIVVIAVIIIKQSFIIRWQLLISAVKLNRRCLH